VSDQNEIRLFDRVKEITYSQGLTPSFALSGASDGFSPLSRFYEHNEVVFYAVTDGSDYEVGSGVYRRADADPNDSITYNELERHPFRSSKLDNGMVNFSPGVKEVFITYPATHSVMMGSGLPSLNVPQRKGMAVWDSENILNYFSNFTFDSSLNSLGVNQPNHFYGLDLGGDALEYSSRVRASGYYVGPTGVYFQRHNGANANLQLSTQPYQGGTQFVHFAPNLTDSQLTTTNQTNSHALIQVSGDVNQYILLQKQDAHTVFAGPVDDCNPSCSEDYPLFRSLVIDDLPMVDLSGIFTSMETLIATSGALVSYTDNSILAASGDLQLFASGVQDNLDAHIASYQSDFRDFEVASSGRIDDFLSEATHPRYCSVRGNNVDGNDDSWKGSSKNQSMVNWLKFPFSHVENESDIGDWNTSQYTYTAPASGIYKIDANVYSHFQSSVGDVLNEFRLVTSGDGTITSYLSNKIYHQDVSEDEVNGGSSWVVDLDVGHKAYLEYKGQPRNFSKMTIHKT